MPDSSFKKYKHRECRAETLQGPPDFVTDLFADVVRDLVDVLVPGHEVTEADGHQADEAEVGPVEEVPTLPAGEQDSPEADVEHEDQEAGGDRDGDEPEVLHKLELNGWNLGRRTQGHLGIFSSGGLWVSPVVDKRMREH